MGWLYVPGSEDWNWDSNSHSEKVTKPWVTLSGMPTQRPILWRGWRTRPWIKLLFGTILNPSKANHGAAEWISSLRVSPANHSARRAKNWVSQTNVGSGQRSTESLAKWDPASSSWKTFQGSLFTKGGWEVFSDAWPTEGSMLNGVVSQQRKSEHPTYEKEYSFWLTPKAQEHGEKSETFVKRMGDRKPGAFSGLRAQTERWPTPRAVDYKHKRANPSELRRTSPGLPARTTTWRTPQASDWKGVNHTGSKTNSGTSLPAQATLRDGNNMGVHNPRFVEALMGWPIGWTEFESLGTEWFHWKQLMRSMFLRLVRR